MENIRSTFRRLWSNSPVLTGVALAMLLLFVANLVGLAIDRRIITGAPAWMKPAKFAISTAIYAGTLAWLFGYLESYKGQARIAGSVTAVVLVLELAIINLQAARGTTSHFNLRTPLDAALFSIMGTAILVLWLASVWIAFLLFRQRFKNGALGWAIRLGMVITVVGSLSGGIMTRPTPDQRAALVHRIPPAIGAHTVGGPDGGPGLPVAGWSTRHGDLRIGHFLGLHGVQIIPLLYGLFLRRTRAAVQKIFIAAGSYLAVTLLIIWQALRGQSVVHPDAIMLWTLAGWTAVTAVGWVFAGRQQSSRGTQISVQLV